MRPGHPVQHSFVFQTRDATIAVVSAARPKRAGSASLAVAIVNLRQVSCGRRLITGFETLPGRTQIGVAGRIVAELVLAEQTVADGSPPLRPGNMGHDAGFAGLDILELVVTPIGNSIDLINAKDLLGCL